MLSLKQYLSKMQEMVSAGSGAIRGVGYVSGSSDGGDTSKYVSGNIVDTDNRNNNIFQLSKTHQVIHKDAKQKVSEELKVGEHDEISKKKSKSKTKMKRKYLGKTRGKTATGQPAHIINIDPTIDDGNRPKAY